MSAATLGAGAVGLVAGGWLAVPVRRSIAAAQLDAAGGLRIAGERARRPSRLLMPSRLVMPVLLAVCCGLAFALSGWRFGWSPELPAYLYFGAAGVAVSAVDIATHRLPDLGTLPSYLIGFVLLAAAALARGEGAPLVRALLAMVALYGFYWLGALPPRGGIGGGDVKLAGVVGLYLGYLGWAEVVLGTFLALGYGAVVGVLLMVAGRAGRRTRLPLGPYMIAGAFTAIILGGPIIRGYVELLSG